MKSLCSLDAVNETADMEVCRRGSCKRGFSKGKGRDNKGFFSKKEKRKGKRNIQKEGLIKELPQDKCFKKFGLRKGKKICLCSKEPFGGPYIIEVDGRMIAISKKYARDIMVEEV